MAFLATSYLAPQFQSYKFNWIKFYEPGTTTPKSIATDSTGGTLIAKAQVNNKGFFETAGGTVFIPFVDGAYDAYLFPNEADADANDTANATRIADNIDTFAPINLTLIGDLSQAYEFNTVDDYKTFATAFPIGKKINLLDRAASFKIITEIGDANTFNVIANNITGQSLDLIINSDTTSISFGMAWDGTTNDADAYEVASNVMGTLKLMLKHPAKTCIIGRNVTITGGINQKGEGGWTLFNSGTVINHGAFTITCIGNEPQFTSLLFQGASELSGTSVHCETSDPENDQNVDAKFISCLFYRAYYSVSMVGRGITFEQCGFSLFRRNLKVDWPNPFNPSALLEQSLEYGMRGYNFLDCQWHASNGYIIENTGYNKDNFRGVTITGYPDTELSIVDGSINDFLVDLNMLYGSQTLFIIGATHKAKNGLITGTYTGERDSTNLDKGFANILSMAADAEIDNVEFDMVCRDVRGSAFALFGTVGNLTIKGMYKDVCKQNDISVAAATRYLIQDFGATINGKVTFEGKVDLPAFANNPTYLIEGLNDAEFEQGHATVPSHIQLFGGNCRGRFGNVSRHSYTGDGTTNRQFTLPAAAQYVTVAGANPNANQGRAGLAIEVAFGGTGDVIMTNNTTLQVTDDFNTDTDVYIYVVHY